MMKSYSVLVLGLVVSLSASAAIAEEHTRVTNPNVVGVEVLGQGLLGSFFFDRVLTDDLAAGVGVGQVSTRTASGADANQKLTLVPVHVNYYFMRQAGSLYVTAGATILTSSDDINGKKAATSAVKFSSSPVLPVFGLGYENRSDAGFLFRATGYGIVGDNVSAWVGFSFGYAF